MPTFDDLAQANPNIREQYDTWRQERSDNDEDATDWDAFREFQTFVGAPDPGEIPPDDMVGEEWKAENPWWWERYADRVPTTE
ncbi:MAG: hypothetical protein IT305_07665 [Chloroflexi bacterium]|nr:hypothetical protein [Chloroflexota bacterium]